MFNLCDINSDFRGPTNCVYRDIVPIVSQDWGLGLAFDIGDWDCGLEFGIGN